MPIEISDGNTFIAEPRSEYVDDLVDNAVVTPKPRRKRQSTKPTLTPTANDDATDATKPHLVSFEPSPEAQPRPLRSAVANAFNLGSDDVKSDDDQKTSGHTSRARKGSRPPGANLVSQLFVGGFVLLVTFTIARVDEQFMPNEQELDELSVPIGNILARRIDLVGKLHDDADDTVALMLASMLYLSRIGPIAVDRTRYALAQRQLRERVEPAGQPTSIRRTPEQSNMGNNGTGSMVLGQSVEERADLGTHSHAADAIAKARRIGLEAVGGAIGVNP